MYCKILNIKGDWQDVKNAAMTTIGKDSGQSPSSDWKRKMLKCEHSPIRKITVSAKWYDIKSWVSVHFARHKIGIEHWVKSQRPDRQDNKNNRDDAPQSALVDHEFDVNFQAIINISRKRLCSGAMPETRDAWIEFLTELKKYEPELVDVCVGECVYRGHCPEYKSCGFTNTNTFKQLICDYQRRL